MKYKTNIQNWLRKVDDSDTMLSQEKRKLKWIAILGTLFILYILSFIGIKEKRNYHTLIPFPTQDSISTDSLKPPGSPFELPTDSFEQLLNQQIYESHPTTK